MDHFTDNLMQYPLPDKLADALRQSDAVAQKMARAGHSVPARIALAPMDYDTVDSVVRHCSRGRFSARSVQWNGRGLDVGASHRFDRKLDRSAA